MNNEMHERKVFVCRKNVMHCVFQTSYAHSKFADFFVLNKKLDKTIYQNSRSKLIIMEVNFDYL